MKSRFGALVLCFAVPLVVLSCSKKKEDEGSTSTPPPASNEQMPPADTSMAPHDTSTGATGNNMGSYTKLNLASLSPEQKDKVMKRLAAENCTCGCVGDTIDKCLRNDPACGVSVTLAMQVIDDVKAGK